MKKLIIVRGPLGVGKTTVATTLAQRLGAEYLSIDQILDDNHLADGDGIPLEHFLQANVIAARTATQSEKTYIVDGCFYYQEQIDDLQEKYSGNVVVFSLTAPVEICIERDSQRKKVYGEDSARFVHMVTTNVHAGYEIDNSQLTAEETVAKILETRLI
jgi:shikimate kinase